MGRIGLKGPKGRRATGSAYKKNLSAVKKRVDEGFSISVYGNLAANDLRKVKAARKELTKLERAGMARVKARAAKKSSRKKK